jgi:hypothetical protein
VKTRRNKTGKNRANFGVLAKFQRICNRDRNGTFYARTLKNTENMPAAPAKTAGAF